MLDGINVFPLIAAISGLILFDKEPFGIEKKNKPVRLTELGREIANSEGVYTWARKEALYLWEEILKMEDSEIHDACIKHVKGLTTRHRWSGHIHRIAYKYGIDHEAIYDVLAMVLRDELLDHRSQRTDQRTTK